jgi:hypothetical protein
VFILGDTAAKALIKAEQQQNDERKVLSAGEREFLMRLLPRGRNNYKDKKPTGLGI